MFIIATLKSMSYIPSKSLFLGNINYYRSTNCRWRLVLVTPLCIFAMGPKQSAVQVVGIVSW